MDNKFLIKDGNSASWEMPEGIPYIEKTFDYWGEQTVYAPGEENDVEIKHVHFYDNNGNYHWLEGGKNYKVIFDGIEYICTAIYKSDLTILLNPSNDGTINTKNDDGTCKNPFAYWTSSKGINPSSSNGFRLFVYAPGAHTISIAEINEEVKPIDTRCLPPASTTSLGAVKQAASVPDGSDINTLLAALREAGIIAPLDQST